MFYFPGHYPSFKCSWDWGSKSIHLQCTPPQVLKVLIIHDKALDHKFLHMLIGQDPELGSSRTAHPEANGQDHRQGIVLHLVGLPIRSSYSVILNH